jgi:hypothetical protein
MVATDDLVERIWVGHTSGAILQVPEVAGVPSPDELSIGAPITDLEIDHGAIWISVDEPPS